MDRHVKYEGQVPASVMVIYTTRRYVLFIGIATIVGIVLFTLSGRNNYERRYFCDDPSAVMNYEYQRSARNKTEKSKHVAFLKTHKCASSTVQNIFMRYSLRYDLNFAVPRNNNYFGSPLLFNYSTMFEPLPWSPLEHNIFAIHTRWNHEEIAKVFGNNKGKTKFVTILRDPVGQFESMFYYLKWYNKFGVRNFEEFVWNVLDELVPRYVLRRYGRNQMLFDTGLDESLFDKEDKVNEHIRKLENNFDLVMFVEEFDESLILLKDLLNWDLSDVAYVKVNSLRVEKNEVSDRAKHSLRSWLRADQKLHDHFYNIFQKKKEKYGLERLAEEVNKLRNMTAAIRYHCSENPRSSQLVYELPCRSYYEFELSFIEYFRTRQRAKDFTLFQVQY